MEKTARRTKCFVYNAEGLLGYRQISDRHKMKHLPISGSVYIVKKPQIIDNLPRFTIHGYVLLIETTNISNTGDAGLVRFTPYGRLDIGGGTFELRQHFLPEGLDPLTFRLPKELTVDAAHRARPEDWINEIGPIADHEYWHMELTLSAI